MSLLTIGKYAGAITAISVVLGMGWAAGDQWGFRPAFKAEVATVSESVEVVARSVDWLKLENFERRLERGQRLTRRECAEYRRLAERLGVQARGC